ncbi:MAG: hypothetical protein LBJ00_11815 [Planctomycetaceae bacterium]|nr:hypothetical protein [Planctomycetaceae bacterium]
MKRLFEGETYRPTGYGITFRIFKENLYDVREIFHVGYSFVLRVIFNSNIRRQ